MKKYIRWIIFGIIAIVLILILIIVGANRNLRQQVQSLLIEKFIKTKIDNYNEDIINIKLRAQAGKIKSEEAMKIVNMNEKEIISQKEYLQKKYEKQGLTSDEISNRFNNLNI